ncbi:hypothetical protein BURCENBC7_AP4167 [Burkholderia cenocepacia BC7]|nr:uncharacterized protein BCN122_II0170 [Burkholderia cenocepacia]EPZ90438.1 hypothetical protein BURCENK562V_C5226 [Burkholderia cenocepacia K56-2Valvano]ERI24682.1 hypothetical protein BURCENBC7_AP4167 [Burkholderia cenocepacia BC7]
MLRGEGGRAGPVRCMRESARRLRGGLAFRSCPVGRTGISQEEYALR